MRRGHIQPALQLRLPRRSTRRGLRSTHGLMWHQEEEVTPQRALDREGRCGSLLAVVTRGGVCEAMSRRLTLVLPNVQKVELSPLPPPSSRRVWARRSCRPHSQPPGSASSLPARLPGRSCPASPALHGWNPSRHVPEARWVPVRGHSLEGMPAVCPDPEPLPIASGADPGGPLPGNRPPSPPGGCPLPGSVPESTVTVGCAALRGGRRTEPGLVWMKERTALDLCERSLFRNSRAGRVVACHLLWVAPPPPQAPCSLVSTARSSAVTASRGPLRGVGVGRASSQRQVQEVPRRADRLILMMQPQQTQNSYSDPLTPKGQRTQATASPPHTALQRTLGPPRPPRPAEAPSQAAGPQEVGLPG